MVNCRKAIVNNANDFVAAYETEDSLIEVTLLTLQEISDISLRARDSQAFVKL